MNINHDQIAIVVPLYWTSELTGTIQQEQLSALLVDAPYSSEIRESAKQLFSFAQAKCGSLHVFDRKRTQFSEPGGHHFHYADKAELHSSNPEAAPRVLFFHALRCDIELDFFYIGVNDDGKQFAKSDSIEKHILKKGGVYLVGFGGERAQGHIAHDFRPMVPQFKRRSFEAMSEAEREETFKMVVFSSHPYDVASPDNANLKISAESIMVSPDAMPQALPKLIVSKVQKPVNARELEVKAATLFLEKIVKGNSVYDAATVLATLEGIVQNAKQALQSKSSPTESPWQVHVERNVMSDDDNLFYGWGHA